MLPTLHGDALDLERFGEKASFLQRASALGMRVSPGFVVPAGARIERDTLEAAVAALEVATGARLGDAKVPLVVAVRSSGARERPGELETLLGVGAMPDTIAGLGERMGEGARAALVVRDFLRGWRRIVRGVRQTTTAPGRAGASLPPPAELEREVEELARQAEVPEDPIEALAAAIEAVAKIGRDRSREPIGVLVHAMTLGGAIERSGSAVVLSRHALSGDPGPVGEWAPATASVGLTTGRIVAPPPVAAQGARASESLERSLPDAFAEIAGWARTLERAHREVVELEVTIERGVPHLVQVRIARLAPRALVRATVALTRADVITREVAVARVPPEVVRAAGTTSLGPEVAPAVLATGLPASPGVAAGRLVVDVDAVRADEPMVLARLDASPEDAPAIRAACAVVTASGGLTSHAAVMSRALGRPCVVSASGLVVERAGIAAPNGTVAVGEWVTVDGATGRLLRGKHEATWTADVPEAEMLLRWHAER